MTHAHRMVETNPSGPAVDAGALVECIEACFDCAQACTACSPTPASVSRIYRRWPAA